MLKHLRVSKSENSITLFISQSFPPIALPKEKWTVYDCPNVHDCNQNNDYITFFYKKKSRKQYRNRRGGSHDSTHLSQREQNFKPLDISRTVPCVIARLIEPSLEFVNVPAALVINTFSDFPFL